MGFIVGYYSQFMRNRRSSNDELSGKSEHIGWQRDAFA
jgi:hypothetical protein